MRFTASLRWPGRDAQALKAHDDGTVAPHPGTTPRSVGTGAKELVTRLVVDVGDHADAWRGAAIDAERAFLWWRSAAANERRDAAAAYLAAIDREETAAFQYSKAWEACCATVPGCRLTTTDRRAPGRDRQPRRPVYDSQ